VRSGRFIYVFAAIGLLAVAGIVYVWVKVMPSFKKLMQAASAPAQTTWVKASFHDHEAPYGVIRDNGDDAPAALVKRLEGADFQVAVHSPHSVVHGDAQQAESAFESLRAADQAQSSSSLLFDTGEELEVAHGPAWQASYAIGGQTLPGNLEHLGLVGEDVWVPEGTPIDQACATVHEAGGFCVVNHPGPGPLTWEAGYWEAPAYRKVIDALEVYNGQAWAGAGVNYESRYLEATAFSGAEGGLRLAAVGGTDTHGQDRTPDLRKKDAPFLPILGTTPPAGDPHGQELEAATLLQITGKLTWTSVEAAVKTRQTVALAGFDSLDLDCPHLGDELHTSQVDLSLDAGTEIDTITLYAEGKPVKTWSGVGNVDYTATVTQPTAYVWGLVDGDKRAMTSAIWVVPPGSSP
jgi:hypothetical protein